MDKTIFITIGIASIILFAFGLRKRKFGLAAFRKDVPEYGGNLGTMGVALTMAFQDTMFKIEMDIIMRLILATFALMILYDLSTYEPPKTEENPSNAKKQQDNVEA